MDSSAPYNSSSDRFSSRMTRRGLLSQGSIALACAAGIPYSRMLAESGEYVEVKTTYGRVRGARNAADLTTFRGIPYGGSVAGANRFKAAPPLKPWTGLRDALVLGPPSPQPGRTARGNEPAPAEDCLVLNIWTPAADGRKRPVMLYSHGGGFTGGSGGSAYQDAGNLARTFDVVVVATNHRLGLMGFLYLGELGGEEYATSGNQGLLDIRDGLKWIRENIEGFGGDPDNVMIFGESGGGAKTSCLYAMPSAAPYFNKASIESGPGIRMLAPEVAAETALLTLKQLGLEKSEWRKVLDAPVDKLMAAQTALLQLQSAGAPATNTGGRRGMGGGSRPGGFGPVMNTVVLPHHPFDPEAPAISKGKPLIVGSNHDEAVFFLWQQRNMESFNLTTVTLKERLDKEYGANADGLLEAYRKSRPQASPSDIYIAIMTARMMGIGSVVIAERKYAQHGAPVYSYIFAHGSDALVPGTQHKVGVAHASEIPYKFYNVRLAGPSGANSQQAADGSSVLSIMNPITDPDGQKASHNMAEMWSTFARTGRPAAKGQPAWPAYTTEKRSTMEIDAQCRVVDDPYRLERQVWERLNP